MKKFKVTVDGQSYAVTVEEQGGDTAGSASALQEVKAAPAAVRPEIKPETSPDKPAAAGTDQTTVNAPMPGAIIEVVVKAGDRVKNGDVLLILEAMKMENEITAPSDGIIEKILVSKGDTVSNGDLLIILS